MLITFLDRLDKWFDRRFIVACWSPVFLAAAGTLGVAALAGWDPVHWWEGLAAGSKTAVGVGALLAITVGAFLLRGVPVVRLHEGLMGPGWLLRAGRDRQLKRSDDLRRKARARWSTSPPTDAKLEELSRPGAYRSLYLGYPHSRTRVRPTRLGNVFASAEEHGYLLYRFDTALWWPRLVTVLPEDQRTRHDQLLIPLLTLLNLRLLTIAVTVVGAGVLVLVADTLTPYVVLVAGGVFLAWACGRAALAAAEEYGIFVRAACEQDRTKVLEAMGLKSPPDLFAERNLWETLNHFLYLRQMPWFTPALEEPANLVNRAAFPFRYRDPPSKSPGGQKIELDATLRLDAATQRNPGPGTEGGREGAGGEG